MATNYILEKHWDRAGKILRCKNYSYCYFAIPAAKDIVRCNSCCSIDLTIYRIFENIKTNNIKWAIKNLQADIHELREIAKYIIDQNKGNDNGT